MELSLEPLGKFLHPPGASVYLATIIAIAGFEVGFNMPYTVAEILALRSLLLEGLEPFASAVKSVPEPSQQAVASAVLLAVACLFTLGGWINVALSLQRSEEPAPEIWQQGLLQSGRALFWLGLVVALVVLVIGGVGGVAAGVLKAWLNGSLGTGWPSLALPALGMSALAMTVAGGLHVLGRSYLMGVVAVAEPATRFWQIPQRSRMLFQATDGWQFFWKMVPVLGAWFVMKLSLSQLIIPFHLVSGPMIPLVSVFGAILNSLLTLGDALVALLGIWWAVASYIDACSRMPESLQTPGA